MNWFMLFVAGLLEIGWAIGLKYTEGFTRLWPSVGTAASMMASVALLGIAIKSLPVGTAYAVWVGIGAVGTAILGMVLLDQSVNTGRLVSLGLIVAGVIGLKLDTPAGSGAGRGTICSPSSDVNDRAAAGHANLLGAPAAPSRSPWLIAQFVKNAFSD